MTSSLLRLLATRPFVAERFWFVLLNQVDLVLSVFAASLGLTELNPWMRGLLEASPFQLLMVKTMIPILIAFIVPRKFLIPSIILLLLITAWNLKELFYFFLFQ